MADGEVYFEFIQVGQQMRVAAIDVTTGIEVIVVTPVNASRHHMQQLALGMLRRRLAGGTEASSTADASIPGRGKLA